MTYNFEIKVQCKGNAVGTTSWLNSILGNSELVVKNTKNGGPGLFMMEKNEPEKKGTFICGVTNDERNEGYSEHNIEGCDIFCAFPKSDAYGYTYGLVDYPLTPAAYEIADEFLRKAREQFAKWWINQ